MGHYALSGLVAPPWLAKAFKDRFNLVNEGKVKSWDDAFGRPFPKKGPGRNLPAFREKQELAGQVWHAVEELAFQRTKKGHPHDWDWSEELKDAFTLAGKQFGISSGTVQRYCKFYEERLIKHLEDQKRRTGQAGMIVPWHCGQMPFTLEGLKAKRRPGKKNPEDIG